jgi:ubiquinone/menaquinone biosynthesis C-methylase UbiE
VIRHNKKFTKIVPVILLIAFLVLADLVKGENRDSWQQPERILDSLGIQPSMIIGEVRAGEGYFTFKLAKRVGERGRIYANDIIESKLQKIQNYCQQKGIENITTVLGEIEDPKFPSDTLEMVIMVYVLHHLEKPLTFLPKVKSYLKPGAPIVIVDRDPSIFGGQDSHFFSKEKILRILEQSRMKVLKVMTFLPRDNIYICQPR